MPTHGSLTKAGKVRNQTPKIASQAKKKLNPNARNLRNYVKRIVHPPAEKSFGRYNRRR